MSDDWPRPLVYFEVRGREPDGLQAFYEALFSWECTGPFFGPGLGGPEPGPAGHFSRSDTPGFTLYVQVRDLDAALAAVPGLGGAVQSPPFDVPGGPTVAGISDPEGNRLVLVQQ